MDLSATIVADSTQVNAEDLLGGPRTVTITKVSQGNADQPVNISLAEIPDRVYRPGKSMRRVLVAAWGPDADTYIGRRMTLYCDPTVRWGGQEVGGVRISEMSDIDGALKLALTITRGNKKPFVVQPLPDAAPTIPPITEDQRTNLGALMHAKGWDDAQKIEWVESQIGRKIASARDLNRAEASALIGELTGGAV